MFFLIPRFAVQYTAIVLGNSHRDDVADAHELTPDSTVGNGLPAVVVALAPGRLYRDEVSPDIRLQNLDCTAITSRSSVLFSKSRSHVPIGTEPTNK